MTIDLTRRRLLAGACATPFATGLVTPALAAVPADGSRPGPFMIGADVTWIAEDEAAGAEYYLAGQRVDPFRLMKDFGFNNIRLRTFVNPENGYSRREPEAKWGGIESVARLGKRVRDAGMDLTLSFHYSDTWADPYNQHTPGAWAGLDLAGLEKAVHDYTRDSLITMRNAGARVDMAIIGNETSYGMMWPTGYLGLEDPADPNRKNIPAPEPAALSAAYDRFAALLKAGIAGARAADPEVMIQIHHHVGHNWDMCRDWLDALIARGVTYDVFGISCYQQENEGDWAKTLNGFIARYPNKGVLVGEYSSRKAYVNELVYNLPNKRGWGTFIWEPTRHQEAIFDKNGYNAGGGARPNLLRDGTGPGYPPPPPGMPPQRPAAGAPRRQGSGGRYDVNPILWQYKEFARKYGG